MIWWWHLGSRDARVPLFSMRFGWSVTIRSMHDGLLFGVKCVGSDMICERFNELRVSSIAFPSGLVSPPGHHAWEWPLKSPVKKIAKGFSALIFECSSWKLARKFLNSSEFSLNEGLLYKTVKNIFFLWNFSSTTSDSSKDRSCRTTSGREFL